MERKDPLDCPEFLDCGFLRKEPGPEWPEEDLNLVWETYCAGPCWPLCYRRLKGAEVGISHVDPLLWPNGERTGERTGENGRCQAGETDPPEVKKAS